MKNRESAAEFLRSVVNLHVPSNARRFQSRVYNGELGKNMLGFNVDPQPAEGKVVEMNDDWVIIKTGRTEFLIADLDLLATRPDVGATILVTPHSRKQFDGRRLDAPDQVDSGRGYFTQTYKIGNDITSFPIDKAALKSYALRDMLTQIEQLKPEDDFRTIAQVLIDAGAREAGLVYNDPLDKDIIDSPPSVTFPVNNNKLSGTLTVSYDRALDYYDVKTADSKGVPQVVFEGVDFTSLANVIKTMVDDGSWKLAAVEVIKPAPKRKLSM